MGLFGKKNNDETKCNKCNLEFSSPERLERHTEKAHGKSSKTQIKEGNMGKHQNHKQKEPKRICRIKSILVLRIHTHQACCQNNTAFSDKFFEIQQFVLQYLLCLCYQQSHFL